MTNLWEIENERYESGLLTVCGVDEAGRGPLAGPVYAAAVILPQGIDMDGLDDSKKLTPKKREALFDIICRAAVSYGIAFATVSEIEEHNILNATYMAMNRAIEQLAPRPEMSLIDGNHAAGILYPTKCIVKGDQKSASIAAASILAKVSRDRLMETMAEKYPQYGFERHKGYPTALHYEKIRLHGVTDIHRRSFLKKLERS